MKCRHELQAAGRGAAMGFLARGLKVLAMFDEFSTKSPHGTILLDRISARHPMILDIARLLVFPALMAFAAASDLFTMTISNRVSVLLAAAFLVLALASGMAPYDILSHLGAGALLVRREHHAEGRQHDIEARILERQRLGVGLTERGDRGAPARRERRRQSPAPDRDRPGRRRGQADPGRPARDGAGADDDRERGRSGLGDG